MRVEGAAYRGGGRASHNLQDERYAMKDDTRIILLRQPGSVEDPLTEIARKGARRMLASALEWRAEAGDEGLRLAAGEEGVRPHGRPDRGREPGAGTEAAQHRRREG